MKKMILALLLVAVLGLVFFAATIASGGSTPPPAPWTDQSGKLDMNQVPDCVPVADLSAPTGACVLKQDAFNPDGPAVIPVYEGPGSAKKVGTMSDEGFRPTSP